jgi:hypothetical protein
MPSGLIERWAAPKRSGSGGCPTPLVKTIGSVRIGDGALGLTWRTELPRVIALMRIPRLIVNFRFAGLDEQQRYRFMKRFDLYMQRGGG